MLVKYYNNKELVYTNRKRFHSFNFSPFYQEEQKSVLLGDGATTKIKTKKSNICNYVTIDDTRWYVTSYVYLNGGQVQLNLQRDVIGEFGIDGCFGKIERGFTDSLLKNRKELGLNQILKERKKLTPSFDIYGNYTVDNHDKEMWGIMYLIKPTSVDPSTGKPYPEQVNINIPGFTPAVVEYDFIEKGTKIKTSTLSTCSIHFNLKFKNNDYIYRVEIRFTYNDFLKSWNRSVYVSSVLSGVMVQYTYDIEVNVTANGFGNNLTVSNYKQFAEWFGTLVADGVFYNQSSNLGYALPTVPDINTEAIDYNGITIKKDEEFYSYTTSYETGCEYGTATTDKSKFYNNFIVPYTNNKVYSEGAGITTKSVQFSIISNSGTFDNLRLSSELNVYTRVYDYTVLTEEEAGIFTIDVSQQLIDEPYIIVVVPLFDVKITGGDSEEYNVSKKTSFMVFNTIIQYLSGDNGYLVDAQIYPYCPVLTSCSAKVLGVPFFSINSSCYEHYCSVQLLPPSDIKKDYIQRSYSIVSPEQTGKFTFNFYDYKVKVNDVDGVNYETLSVIIKTALKPFSILSSAVIQPDTGSLVGITYSSDLRGSQPTSNGFECSLSSNAFQSYKRNNSNYQQIFSLQKEELAKQHEVEKVNDITSAVVQTVTAGAMATMAGAASADGFWGDFVHSQAIGAAAAGTTATVAVGAAMTTQAVQNEKLRAYERDLQQQQFDLQIGTIKNLPNSVNRISSFNEIIMKDFWFCIEIYECSELEKEIVDTFISNYAYGIGVFDYLVNYQKDGWFLRSTLITSNYNVNLHIIAENELMGGIYLYEQV